MLVSKIKVEMVSYGQYTKWERKKKSVPQIVEFTTHIKAKADVEFGYILKIRKAKGRKIDFVIEHPPFKDEQGDHMPPFKGEVHIHQNEYLFYLGDTIWEPIEDKKGEWVLKTYIEGELLAKKTLYLV